jgi:hypothetical protein
MGLSIRAYARHRGVSHVAVKKAIDSGRIHPLPDGTIDPERADAEWSRNTLPLRQGRSSSANPQRQSGQREERGGEAHDVVTPPLASGGTSLLQARTVNEVLKAKLRQVELAEKKEELVDRAKAVAHVFKLARAERDAWLNWPNRISAQMAARLQVDAHTLHIVLEAAVREHLQELGELRPKLG